MNVVDKVNLHKEIDLIQACITRMANNSFLIKGWAISIIAVVLALSDKNTSAPFLALIVLIPLLSFWYLDSFFLHTERMYREMYAWVINERSDGSKSKMYDLNPHRFKDLKDKNGRAVTRMTVMFSETLLAFYGIPVFLTLVIMAYSIATSEKKDFPVTKVEIINSICHKIDSTRMATDAHSLKVQIPDSITKVMPRVIDTTRQFKPPNFQ